MTPSLLLLVNVSICPAPGGLRITPRLLYMNALALLDRALKRIVTKLPDKGRHEPPGDLEDSVGYEEHEEDAADAYQPERRRGAGTPVG